MGSIHRQPGKPNWVASFREYDQQTNRWKQVLRSTFTRNKRQAQKICDAWDDAAKAAHNGTLSVDAAREIIARGVANIFATANLTSLPSASIKAWCDRWLEAKAIEAEQTTHARYKRVLERFTAFLGSSRSSCNLAILQSDDITQFRDREAKELSRSTANLCVKVLRACLGEAERQGLIASNPAKKVKTLESTSESKRRPFTLDEIKRILEACGNDVEWRGLVLFGLYLGQRLGDLARLTWRAIDFETNEIAFTARKTGRRIVLPLVQPLIDYLSALPASDNPNAHIFANAAKHKRTASLSNQFRDILVEAGLAEARDYRTTTKGRASQREASEISFHSLRHSAVTMLKASGLSDVFAREIVGHESAAVSRRYTHLSTDDLRNAMQRLPDVTSADTQTRSNRATQS
jgi:integrase